MSLRPITTLRHAITALALLAVALLGTEIWLKSRTVPTPQIVTTQAIPADQSLLVPSAVSHHELRRLLKTNHVAGKNSTPVAIRVNSLGCRGGEFETPAPEGTYRILLLGDDSICGTNVPEEETLAARLTQFLSKTTASRIEVINGGVPGYCPLLSSLQFEHDLAKLKPNLVILHFDMTDVADDACYRSLVLREGNHQVCSHATLRLQAKPENAMLHFVRNSATVSWVFTKTRKHGPDLLSMTSSNSMPDTRLSWITDNPPDLRLQVRHAMEPIRDLQDSVAQSGGRLLITTCPLLWQVISADEAPGLSRRWGITGTTPYASRLPFELLSGFCDESHLRFCDSSPAFQNDNAARLFSRDAPVLSRIGMALYAREIARFLVEHSPSAWDAEP